MRGIAFLCILLTFLNLECAYSETAPLPNPETGAWFYNRSGATAAERDADFAECLQFSRAMIGQPPVSVVPGLASDVLATIFGPNRNVAELEYADDCMIAGNYRRFNLAKTSLKTYMDVVRSLDETNADALAGREKPQEGELARQNENYAWLSMPTDGQLPASTALPPRAVASGYHVTLPSSARLYADSGYNTGSKKPVNFGPNDAIVIAAVRNTGGGMVGITFASINSDGSPNVSAKKRGYLTLIGKGGSEDEKIFVVPAGRYAMAGVFSNHGMRLGMAQYCIRTPYFDVSPGEVVHLGTFVAGVSEKRDKSAFGGNRAGGEIAPRIRVEQPVLQSGTQALLKYPDLAARLTPGSLSNGANFPCVASPAVFQEIRTMDLPQFE